MKKYIYGLLFFFIFMSLSAQRYSSSLADYEAYKAFRGKPLSDKFSNIESVKVVYDLRKQKMYYFNSTLIPLHYDFVTNYLRYNYDLQIFNNENYSNTLKDLSLIHI